MPGPHAPKSSPPARFPKVALAGTLLGLLLATCFPAPTPSPIAPASSGPRPGGDAGVAEQAARALLPPGLDLIAAAASQSPCLFVGVASSGEAAWWAAATRLLPSQTSGYAGPIDLLVGLTPEGKITGVRVLAHRETPTFVAGLDEPWFLDQFVGKTAADPLEPGVDFDGITHATVTIDAMAADLREVLRLAAAIGLASGTPTGKARAVSGPARPGGPLDGAFSAVPPSGWCLAIALLVIAAGHRLPRPLADALLVVLLGVITQQFLSLSHLPVVVAGIRLGELPPFGLLSYLVVAILAALGTVRGYCRFLCPMGRLQDLIAMGADRSCRLLAALSETPSSDLSQVRGTLPDQGKVPSPSLTDAPGLPTLASCDPAASPATNPHPAAASCQVRPLGRFLAWGALAAMAAGMAPPLENLEAFTPLFLRRGGPAGLLLVTAALVGAAIAPRFYCRGLCPLNPLFEDLETARRLLTRSEEPHEPPSVPR